MGLGPVVSQGPAESVEVPLQSPRKRPEGSCTAVDIGSRRPKALPIAAGCFSHGRGHELPALSGDCLIGSEVGGHGTKQETSQVLRPCRCDGALPGRPTEDHARHGRHVGSPFQAAEPSLNEPSIPDCRSAHSVWPGKAAVSNHGRGLIGQVCQAEVKAAIQLGMVAKRYLSGETGRGTELHFPVHKLGPLSRVPREGEHLGRSGGVGRQDLVDRDRQGCVLAGGPSLIANRDEGEVPWPGQLNMVAD